MNFQITLLECNIIALVTFVYFARHSLNTKVLSHHNRFFNFAFATVRVELPMRSVLNQPETEIERIFTLRKPKMQGSVTCSSNSRNRPQIHNLKIPNQVECIAILAGRRLCHVRGDPQPEPSRAGHGQHHHVRPGAPPQEVQGQERLRLILHQRLTTTAQEQEAKEQHSSLTLLLPRAVLLLGIMVVHCVSDTRRLCSVLF